MKKVLFVVAILVAGSAQALSESTTMDVSAEAVPVCMISTTPVIFGQYSGAQINTTATIDVLCSKLEPYNVTIDAGQHYGETWRRVAMTEVEGNFMKYGLYKPLSVGDGEWSDSGFTNTYPYGGPLVGLGSGATQSYTVSARLWSAAMNGYPAVGQYTDVVQVSVYY
jgi:spore coat protein U-like protein